MEQKGRIHWLPVLACFWGDITISQIVAIIFNSIDPNIGHNGFFSSPAGIAQWILGLLLTMIAGWIAATYAKEERFLHGFLVGALGLLLTLVAVLGSPEPVLTLPALIGVLLAPLLAGLAGYASRWTVLKPRQRGK